MTRPERDHSVSREPHLSQESFKADGAEDKAAGRLTRERLASDPERERALHSVFDEPTTLPNREPVRIDRDWNCRNCGYNLRGLMTGHPCPECGVVERYEPPREGEVTYADWLARSTPHVSSFGSWGVAAAVPFAGIPFAILAALITVEYGTVLMFVLVGPIVSEVLKIAMSSILVERKSRYVHRPGHLYLMTLGTALVFGAVQNILVLNTYYRQPAIELMVWRWSACLVMHCFCTLIAAHGVVGMWAASCEDGRRPILDRLIPYLSIAAVIHAAFNLYIYLSGRMGYGF